MRKFAVVRLRTPDGRLHLQRRNQKTPLYPGELSFFGGQVEVGETPEDCIQRELKEETDLADLAIEHAFSMSLLPEVAKQHDIVEIHVFDALIHDAGFEVNEGASTELHTLDSALEQPDLVPATRIVLQDMKINGGT